jgi:tetratricopeptide (TPR) repeat protein
MGKLTGVALGAFGAILLGLTSRGPAAEKALTAPEIYQQTRRSTAWVLAKNENRIAKIGTGFLVDRSRKLLVTNYHVIDRTDMVNVTFPLYQAGQAVIERKDYIKYDRPIRGWVVATDATRDLAVIELEVVPHATTPLKLADDSVCPGERVHLVGNPGTSELLWVYNSGTVRQVSSRSLTDDRTGKVINTVAVEVLTQAPVQPGNSGGPMVNDRGELAGVATMSNQAAHLAWCVDVSEVRDVVRMVQAYPKTAQRLLNPRTDADRRDRERFYREFGPADRAVAVSSEALQVDPKNARAYHARGAAHARHGDLERALADFNEALRLDPQSALTFYNRALVHLQRGQRDRAIADFGEVIRIEPKNSLAYLDRGTAHEHQGEFARAVVDYQVVIDLDPQNMTARNAAAWIWATCPDDKLRDGKKAKEYATQACEATGWMNATFLDTLAAACAECGQFEEAVRWQKKAIQLARPEDKLKFFSRIKTYQAGKPYRLGLD